MTDHLPPYALAAWHSLRVPDTVTARALELAERSAADPDTRTREAALFVAGFVLACSIAEHALDPTADARTRVQAKRELRARVREATDVLLDAGPGFDPADDVDDETDVPSELEAPPAPLDGVRVYASPIGAGWCLRIGTRVFLNGESFAVVDGVRDALEGRPAVGELRELAASIRRQLEELDR